MGGGATTEICVCVCVRGGRGAGGRGGLKRCGNTMGKVSGLDRGETGKRKGRETGGGGEDGDE